MAASNGERVSDFIFQFHGIKELFLFHLFRGTPHRAVRTEHTAIPLLRSQEILTVFAFIKMHARIMRHCLCLLMLAHRTGNR
jgi:hypothetical protein